VKTLGNTSIFFLTDQGRIEPGSPAQQLDSSREIGVRSSLPPMFCGRKTGPTPDFPSTPIFPCRYTIHTVMQLTMTPTAITTLPRDLHLLWSWQYRWCRGARSTGYARLFRAALLPLPTRHACFCPFRGGCICVKSRPRPLFAPTSFTISCSDRGVG